MFGTVAAAYAEHRPGYPPDAVGWALDGVGRPAHVVDLAAGTGKLTADLVERPGVTVTAVEPDPAMLHELTARFPAARAVEGTAERIPLEDGCADAVLVGTAWHWFDPPRALAEISRVLRPRGVLAVLSTVDDPAVDWVTGYHAAAEHGRPVASQVGDHVDGFPHPAFTAPEQRTFRHDVATTVDGLIATLSTHSWALMSEPADREAAFDRIRTYLAARSETGSGAFTLPLLTPVLRALRR